MIPRFQITWKGLGFEGYGLGWKEKLGIDKKKKINFIKE